MQYYSDFKIQNYYKQKQEIKICIKFLSIFFIIKNNSSNVN